MTDNIEEYDYIVVGSGPGGCAVSEVLSSKRHNTVFMLEAGEDKDNDVPIHNSTYAGQLENNYYPQYFWTIPQVPQVNVNMDANYTNGRVYGGGSSVNGLQRVKGSKNVFDKWFAITGDTDWAPYNVFKVYQRTEKLIAVTPGPYQGYDGEISVRQAPTIATNTATKFISATNAALGLPEISDYNNPTTPFGPFSRWQYYEKADGSRESSSTAILKPILLKRKNFKLSPRSTVTKIIWGGKCGNKAIGVKYFHNDQVRSVYARKRVILSAGIQTPLILEHSGVGNKTSLQSFGIKVVSDLQNVGQNLANHLIVLASFNKNPADLPSPDVNALYGFGAFFPDPITPVLTDPRKSEWIGIDLGSTMEIAILQTQPKSLGYANIQSKDALTVPLASEAALDNPLDLQQFMDIIRQQLIPIANQLNTIDPTYILTGPDPAQVNDDVYLQNYIMNNIDHAHHWQSQCIMAPKNSGGVVNSAGSVYGTTHLSIADVCIVPFTVDGNTAGVAYLIGYIVGHKILKGAF